MSRADSAKTDPLLRAAGSHVPPGFSSGSNSVSPGSGSTWGSIRSGTDLPSSAVLSRVHDRAVEQLLAAMAALNPADPRPVAVLALARHLVTADRSTDLGAGAHLAVDLLSAESEDTMRLMVALLEAGWDGTVGQLLACARSTRPSD